MWFTATWYICKNYRAEFTKGHAARKGKVMDVTIIKANKDEECCCCRSNMVDLHKWADSVTQAEHQHCDLCYSTLAGNTCVYPTAYDSSVKQIMQHVNNVANVVLKKLARKEE